jgi:hypothetical protein
LIEKERDAVIELQRKRARSFSFRYFRAAALDELAAILRQNSYIIRQVSLPHSRQSEEAAPAVDGRCDDY